MEKLYRHAAQFELESGEILPELTIAYTALGTLNATKSNVVWVCHALTANSNPSEWWAGLVGPGKYINTDVYFVICANVIGSCYGSTGPTSINPITKSPYWHLFPLVTIRDMVNAHQVLFEALNLDKIQLLLGGSLGGQQALEWSILKPEQIVNMVLFASNAKHSAWGIAFNESQRLAIYADRTYHNHSHSGGQKGLRAARAMALLSYRNYTAYGLTQQEESNDKYSDFKAASYQRYQGDKLVARFNAHSYVRLSQAMDSHNVARNRGELSAVLGQLSTRTLVIGIDSDLLFPLAEQQFMYSTMPNAIFKVLQSAFGHDGFLLEYESIINYLHEFLANQEFTHTNTEQLYK